jgi:hypothetical protein
MTPEEDDFWKKVFVAYITSQRAWSGSLTETARKVADNALEWYRDKKRMEEQR